jgi:hypothetical protein
MTLTGIDLATALDPDGMTPIAAQYSTVGLPIPHFRLLPVKAHDQHKYREYLTLASADKLPSDRIYSNPLPNLLQNQEKAFIPLKLDFSICMYESI